jgi:hypothetical protein
VFFIFGGSLVFCFRFLEIMFKFPLSNPLALIEGFSIFFKLNVHGHTSLHCVATNTHMHFILLGLSHVNLDRFCCEILLVTLQTFVAFKRSFLISLRISK